MPWRFLYNAIATPAMESGLLFAALGSSKAREALLGRMGEGTRLNWLRSRCRENYPRVLIHCASAGELEGAIPLMEALDKQIKVDMILSFFSPSAKERSRAAKLARGRIFLPIDSAPRVKRMLNILQPDVIVYMKHDIWPNLTWEAAKRHIPTILVNGNFRPDSTRNHPLTRGFNHEVLGSLSAIYAVAEDDADRFRDVAGAGITIRSAGDTRYDRVVQRALASHKDQGELAKVLDDVPVMVAGSTWPEDESRIFEAWSEIQYALGTPRLLLVPHVIKPDHIEQIKILGTKHGLSSYTLSEIEEENKLSDVIIVDKMGILAGLYGLGKVAYVGGGFGRGVHSVLEPAVFGVPVLFGPNHLMSHEARDLIKLGAAKTIKTSEEIFESVLDALQDGQDSKKMGKTAEKFVEDHTGISDRIAREIARLARL